MTFARPVENRVAVFTCPVTFTAEALIKEPVIVVVPTAKVEVFITVVPTVKLVGLRVEVAVEFATTT